MKYQTKQMGKLIIKSQSYCLIIVAILILQLPTPSYSDEVLNYIAADVHHEPISYHDLAGSSKVAKEDTKTKQLLEREISYKLIEKEAQKNRIQVRDEEVDLSLIHI